MRGAGALVAVLLVAGACASGTPPDRNGDVGQSLQTPAASPGAGTPEPARSGSGGTRSTFKPAPAGGNRGATARPDGGGSPGGGEGPSDDGSVGDNALVYLRSSTPKLVVEVDAVLRMGPADEALDHLRSVLAGVVSKPAGIEIRPTDTFSGGSATYTDAQLQALQDEHRQTRSSGGTAAIYVLYVDGRYGEPNGQNALGLAFSSSMIVLFKDQIRRAETPLVSAAGIERAVIAHEAGHLLGLVNIGYTSPRPHEDPKRPHHSSNRESVMYWAVEDVIEINRLLEGRTGPPDQYDADDRADLDDRKAGRL